MKIVYFYQYFGTSRGCWSTRVYEFTRRWVERGDEVTVVTSVYDKSDLRSDRLLARYEVEGIDVRVINIGLSNKHGFVRRLWSFFVFAVLSCWYAMTLRADVVVASSGPITIALPGLIAKFLRRRSFVFEVRDVWPDGAVELGVLRNRLAIRAARWFERLCYRAADRIVACSEGQADWIAERHPGLGEIAVVPHGSDNELVTELENHLIELPPWAWEKYLVLYAGSLGLMDGCRQILDAAEVLQKRGAEDVEFVIIGDGKERQELEELAASRTLANVHFLGLLPKVEVFPWLLRATCALVVFRDLPFLSTSSPNKLFDAFAAGAPVVQVTQGWIKELLERERCGVTVPANDPEAMADAIQHCCDEDVCASMSLQARRVAKEQFDRGYLATKLRAVLTEVISEETPVGAPAPSQPAYGGNRTWDEASIQ